MDFTDMHKANDLLAQRLEVLGALPGGMSRGRAGMNSQEDYNRWYEWARRHGVVTPAYKSDGSWSMDLDDYQEWSDFMRGMMEAAASTPETIAKAAALLKDHEARMATAEAAYQEALEDLARRKAEAGNYPITPSSYVTLPIDMSCHQCESTNINEFTSNLFGVPVRYECRDCNYMWARFRAEDVQAIDSVPNGEIRAGNLAGERWITTAEWRYYAAPADNVGMLRAAAAIRERIVAALEAEIGDRATAERLAGVVVWALEGGK
jgi:hypothetical protein